MSAQTPKINYEALNGLDPRAAHTYRRLGALPAPEPGDATARVRFDASDVGAACSLDLEVAGTHIDRLLHHELLVSDMAGRLRFAAEVRPHALAAAQALSGLDRQTTLRRWLDWLLLAADRAERIVTPRHRQKLAREYRHLPLLEVPFTDEPSALAWLQSRQGLLIAGVRASAEARWDALTWQLTVRLWPMWHRLGPCQAWVDTHELALAAARRCADPAAETAVVHALGVGLRGAGRLAEAMTTLRCAHELTERLNNAPLRAQVLQDIGSTYRAQQNAGSARATLTRAKREREALRDPAGVALTEIELGRVELQEGDAEKAVKLLTQAVEGLRRHEAGPYELARARAYLGQATFRAGEATVGERLLTMAEEAFTVLGQRAWQARCLTLRAVHAQARQQTVLARELLARANESYPEEAGAPSHVPAGRSTAHSPT